MSFYVDHLHGMDGDQPLRLRQTRLSGSKNKYVKSLTKIFMINRFNYA